jgi:hypothetical protein
MLFSKRAFSALSSSLGSNGNACLLLLDAGGIVLRFLVTLGL